MNISKKKNIVFLTTYPFFIQKTFNDGIKTHKVSLVYHLADELICNEGVKGHQKRTNLCACQNSALQNLLTQIL